MMKKFLISLIFSVFTLALFISPLGIRSGAGAEKMTSAPPQIQSFDTANYKTKTLNELPVSPIVAGSGASYFDDDTVYYLDTGNTIGYNVAHSDYLFDLDIIFNSFATSGSWFSLTVRANGLDRTQSANLTQKGYSFLIWQSGKIEVHKSGVIATGTAEAIYTGEKHNLKFGAINEENTVKLVFIFDGETIIEHTDDTDPFLDGDWFNICSDGGLSADLISTKATIYPNYFTYTLSTLGSFPIRAGNPLAKVDKNNNVEILNGSNTVGFNEQIENFSFEFKVNFSKFNFPSNFYVTARASGFSRALSPDLAESGYSFRFGSTGALAIVKLGATVGTGAVAAFQTNRDYIFEVGIINIDETKTNLFIAIDGEVVISVFDTNNPIQKMGFLNINPDGDVACKMTSSNTRLTPLQAKQWGEGEKEKIDIKFYNTFSFDELDTASFGERNLKSILINGISVYSLNQNYYGLSGEERVDAVSLHYEGNTLTIEICKEIYLKTTQTKQEFEFQNLTIKKYSLRNGLNSPSGFKLKQDFVFSK